MAQEPEHQAEQLTSAQSGPGGSDRR